MLRTITFFALGAGLIGAAEIPAHDAGKIRSAVTRAMDPLLRQSPNFVRIGGCNSCHSQDLPTLAQSVARSRGIPAGADIVLVPDTESAERVFEHSGLLGAGSLGYAALSYVARKQPLTDKTDATVNFLLARQEADGRWSSRSNRQPLSSGDHHATAFAIFTLRSYGRPVHKKAIDAQVAKAIAWLQENPPVTNQDISMQIFGLVWGGADRAAIAKAAAAVPGRQRADGGWSQLHSLESDAYATGQALYAMALAGVPTAEPSYRRGIDFLLRTQAADGTWHVNARSKPVQPYFESGFPYGHDQWISAAGTSWAAMALSMAVEPVKRASR